NLSFENLACYNCLVGWANTRQGCLTSGESDGGRFRIGSTSLILKTLPSIANGTRREHLRHRTSSRRSRKRKAFPADHGKGSRPMDDLIDGTIDGWPVSLLIERDLGGQGIRSALLPLCQGPSGLRCPDRTRLRRDMGGVRQDHRCL